MTDASISGFGQDGPWATHPAYDQIVQGLCGVMSVTGETSGGLAVLSKYPFRDLGVTESFEGWHPAWHVLVDSPIGPLQLLLVHLRAPYTRREGLGGVFTAEDSHVTQLSTVAEKCAADVPTVVLGDFNESTDGAAVRFLERRGFKNALPLFRPGEETWHYERSIYGQTVDTLDHILYDDATLDPLNAYVRYVGRSDHYPVTVLLERRPDYN